MIPTGSWLIWALLSALFAALTAIFAKIGVTGINATYATFVRTLVIAATLILVLSVGRQWEAAHAIPTRSWVFLVLSGLATGASWLCYFRALQMGDAARVAPIDKLSVVLVAIIGAAALGERLSLLNWTGVGLIAAGAILVALH
jgi:transporter family protein